MVADQPGGVFGFEWLWIHLLDDYYGHQLTRSHVVSRPRRPEAGDVDSSLSFESLYLERGTYD